jgi:hypothetical protein
MPQFRPGAEINEPAPPIKRLEVSSGLNTVFLCAAAAARSGQSRAARGPEANPRRAPKSKITEKYADQATGGDPERDAGADVSISLHGVGHLCGGVVRHF